jgi:hypothetical protein
MDVSAGIVEVASLLSDGLLGDPFDSRFTNTP